MSKNSKHLWFLLKLVCILASVLSLACGIHIALTPDWNPESRLFFCTISLISSCATAFLAIVVGWLYRITKQIKELRQSIDETATRIKKFQQKVDEFQKSQHQ